MICKIPARFRVVHRFLVYFTLSLFAAVSLSCKNQGVETAYDLSHNVNDPTMNNEGAWQVLTEPEYYDYMLPLIGMTPRQLLPNNHALTQRAQEWLDLFHNNLISKYPSQAQGIPKPRARVLKIDQPNAFVGKVITCFTGPTTVEGADDKPDAFAGFLDFSKGKLEVFNTREYQTQLAGLPCKPLTSPKDMASLARAFNRFYGPDSCNMEVNTRGEALSSLKFTGDCGATASLKKLYIMRVADLVHFFTGAFTEFTQEQFAAVVAHELGHYYRSHGLEPGDTFDYFYIQGQKPESKKPVHEHKYDTVIPRIKMSTLMIDNFSRLRNVAGQNIQSSLYMAAGSLVQIACSEQDCPESCTLLKSNLNKSSYMRSLGAFPFSDVSRTQIKTYLDHENAVMACLDDIKFATDRDAAVNLLARAVLNPTFPVFLISNANPTLDQAITDLSKFLQTFLKIYSWRHGGAIDEINTLGGLLRYFDSGLKKMEGFATNLYDQIYEKKLGYYTAEQEADEISLEWLSDLGIDPHHAVETYLAFTKYTSSIGSGSPFRDLEWDTCSYLYDNKWVDTNGKPRFVALGNLLDDHHGSCYRAFNTSREIDGHEYKLKTTKPSLLTDGKWTALATLAGNPGSLPVGPITGFRHSVLGRQITTPCTFAPQTAGAH